MTPHEKKTLAKYKQFCDYCGWYKRHYGVEYTGIFILPDEIAVEKELEKLDRADFRFRCEWNGQESVDEDYEGIFDADKITIN